MLSVTNGKRYFHIKTLYPTSEATRIFIVSEQRFTIHEKHVAFIDS